MNLPTFRRTPALLLALSLGAPACVIHRASLQGNAEDAGMPSDSAVPDARGDARALPDTYVDPQGRDAQAASDAFHPRDARRCSPEVCNAFDDDCDGRVDEAAASSDESIYVSVCEVRGAACTATMSDGQVFLFCDTHLAWPEANNACLGLDAYAFASVESAPRNMLLNAMSTRTERDAWMGLNDRVTEGVWRWSDDSLLGSFQPIEQGNADDRDCMALRDEVTLPPMELWHAHPCEDERSFFCEATIQAIE